MSDERKSIVFGTSIIDFSRVLSINFSINKYWNLLENGEKNSCYYVLTVMYDGREVQAYAGNRNDVMGLLLYLEKIDFINSELIGDFDKFLKKIKKNSDDASAFNKLCEDNKNEDDE